MNIRSIPQQFPFFPSFVMHFIHYYYFRSIETTLRYFHNKHGVARSFSSFFSLLLLLRNVFFFTTKPCIAFIMFLVWRPYEGESRMKIKAKQRRMKKKNVRLKRFSCTLHVILPVVVFFFIIRIVQRFLRCFFFHCLFLFWRITWVWMNVCVCVRWICVCLF